MSFCIVWGKPCFCIVWGKPGCLDAFDERCHVCLHVGTNVKYEGDAWGPPPSPTTTPLLAAPVPAQHPLQLLLPHFLHMRLLHSLHLRLQHPLDRLASS